jgi:hypothetical protein
VVGFALAWSGLFWHGRVSFRLAWSGQLSGWSGQLFNTQDSFSINHVYSRIIGTVVFFLALVKKSSSSIASVLCSDHQPVFSTLVGFLVWHGRFVFQMVGLAFQVVAPAFNWNGRLIVCHGQQ